ncbi:MAG: FtsX-like permease family protein [Clostridia bacterium]|nr:FtsX-like permease family protein [Clostridia bacterium]
MGILNKMLFREIIKSKSQFLAAVAVIFAGISVFSASYMSYLNLKNSKDYYYEKYKFLDYYAEAKNITPEVLKQVKALDGVKEANVRISEDVGVDMGKDKRITLRLISMPDDKKSIINDIFFTSGTYFSSKFQNSCMVNRKFAEYYRLSEGDVLKAVINLRIYELKIDGIVESPEFIYTMKSVTSISPSAENFGIVYIKESTARTILGYGNSYNQLHVLFEKNADIKATKDKIEKLLKPYGFSNGIERKDQLSHKMLIDDIEQLEEMSVMFPAIFLTVAAMIIYVMQRRLISTQRTLIGVMKAFGYTNKRILLHYILFSLLISVVGSVLGVAVGPYISKYITAMYTRIYSIPVLDFKFYWDILFTGVLLSMSFCLIAGYSSAKRILSIQPAEAMRSERPTSGKRIFLERIKLIWGSLNFGWKMSIRNIFRSRQRSIFTILGFIFTIMLFMISIFFIDSIDNILVQHFYKFQQQDYKIVFSKPASYYDALELSKVKGVRRSEPIMEIPVEIKKGWNKKNTLLVGLVDDNSFYNLIDENQRPIQLPNDGMLMAKSIADRLMVKAGDTVTVRFFAGTVKEKDVKVAGIVKQYTGFSCFMSLKQEGSLLEEGNFATGALIKADKGMYSAVKEELFKIPGVEVLENRLNDYKAFTKFLELTYMFIALMVLFASIMGFAIIFNTTVINITERRREFASLKVLGYTRGEVENVILRENLLLGFIALLPGALVGRLMCGMLGKMFVNDLFVLDVLVYPRTYIMAFASIFVFIICAQMANRNSISGLDMVEVLKNREG